MKNRFDFFRSVKAEGKEVNVSQGDGGKMLLQLGTEFNYTVAYLTDTQAKRLAGNITQYLATPRE